MKDKKKKTKGKITGIQYSEVTVDVRLHRLLEISHDIESLRLEQERLLQSLQPNAAPELSFDDDRRRIYWDGGSVKLGKKSYRFTKTIWFGENHQADFSEVEENVWKKYLKTAAFVPLRTVTMLVRHTQKNLTEAGFPYEIETLKNFSSRELEGFRLVSRTVRKKS